MKIVEGNIIDIENHKIYPAEIIILNGKIAEIQPNNKIYDEYICPGFIDAHVHIESSMLTPYEFSKAIIARGTVAIINDPHEIANILGVPGIQFMLDNSRQSLIKTFFGIPSCVPATPYDSAGSQISDSDIEKLAQSGEFILLSEVMNVPGVIECDREMMAKLNIAKKYDLSIDGHAPLLTGEMLKTYIQNGITTDHECSTLEEAREKIRAGMKILIREGSAAKNYEALKSLIKTNPDDVMFCTDDSHPDTLLDHGHIDRIVKKAMIDGFDMFDILKVACLNPIKHYKLDVGKLKKGENADFITIRNLKSFEVLNAYINGIKKYEKGIKPPKERLIDVTCLNNFNHFPISIEDIRKSAGKNNLCIEIIPGEIVTKRSTFKLQRQIQQFESDIDNDILKIVYLNRYHNGNPQISFIKGFGLKKGAFATTISHDSHNIIAIGSNDRDLKEAINIIIEQKGGLAVVNDTETRIFSLPIGGIMTDRNLQDVASGYKKLKSEIRLMGCQIEEPFMTLSFMSLIVIPELKIGERGLFDYNAFDFVDSTNTDF